MEKGISNNTKYVINYIGKEKLDEIDNYISRTLQEGYITFQNKEQIEEAFNSFLNDYLSRINETDRNALLNYTGLGFRKVNSILRGIWDYEKNGKLTDEVKREANELAESLRKSLLKVPELPFNMSTYRGVGMSTFYASNISNLEELEYLKGNYFYEDGFTSTSMLRETSFFAKQPEWGSNCNIEIEYVIPAYSEDGICLHSPDLIYQTNQNEFLINSSSLFKVLDVLIDKSTNTAKIKMMLIPQKVWNPFDYEMERKEENSLK